MLIDSLNEHLEEGVDVSNYISVVHCVEHNWELAVCDAK